MSARSQLIAAAIVLLVLTRPSALSAQDETESPTPRRLEPTTTEPDDDVDARDASAVGHVRWVERDDPGGDVSTGLLVSGGVVGGVGVLVLLAEGVWLGAALGCLYGACPPLPPEELTFVALAAVGGGVVLAALGALVGALGPPATEHRRPVGLLDPVVRF